MGKMIERLRGAIKWAQENREVVMKWAAAIGYVIAAFGAMFVAVKVFGIITAIVQGAVGVFGFLLNVIKVVRAAMIMLNIVVMANPWVIAAIGIGLIIAGLIKLAGGFQNIWDFLKRMGEFFLKHHPFMWMINLMDKVFPGFKSAVQGLMQGVVDAFKKAFEWLDNNIFQPFKKLFAKLFDFDASKFIAGQADIITPEGDPYAAPGGKKPGGGGGLSGTMAGLSEVRGGGGQIKNITINIQKLNDGGITISTATLGMGTAQVRAELERMLLSVVNDVNYQ
jgi:hypothetical protein